jgi:hypothetical protein
MKKFIISFVFTLAMCGVAFAQTSLPELDKIRQIKLLESTRADVKRIFGEYSEEFVDDDDGEDQIDEISTENMTIRFYYSLGTCADDDDEEWNVPKGSVTEINVILDESVKAEDLKIDLAKFEKIKEDEDDEIEEEEEEDPDDFIYYDKEKNASYGLSDGEIKNIKFTPAEKSFSALCGNETMREFVSHKEWLMAKLRDRPHIIPGRPFANLGELILSKNELTADCPTGDLSQNESDDEYFKIVVAAKAESSDPTDVLTYNYTVSGGKVVGSGANVVWDLSGVKPGNYTITAGADNGCGVCGTTKTETITVKEASCPQK